VDALTTKALNDRRETENETELKVVAEEKLTIEVLRPSNDATEAKFLGEAVIEEAVNREVAILGFVDGFWLK
jgi:hypothetical protein